MQSASTMMIQDDPPAPTSSSSSTTATAGSWGQTTTAQPPVDIKIMTSGSDFWSAHKPPQAQQPPPALKHNLPSSPPPSTTILSSSSLSASATTSTTSSPSSSTSSRGPASLLSAATSGSPATGGSGGAAASGGSPLLRNTTVPQGGAGVRLHKTLSLGEKKRAVALPVVSISLPPFTPASLPPTTDALRRFPPPPTSSSSAASSSSTSSSPATAAKEAEPNANAHSTVDLWPPAKSNHQQHHGGQELSDHTPRNQQTPLSAPEDGGGGVVKQPTSRHAMPEERKERAVAKEPAKESAAGRNYIVFPSLAEMADTEAGKRASLSLCSDGAPSVQFRRYFLFPDTGAALFSNLTTQTCWMEDRENCSGRTPSKFAWFGDAQSELTSGGAVIKHEEWTRIPLLRELRDKLESEFHTTFNAVHCAYFRNGSESSGGYSEDAQSQDTDAVFICLGQKRNLLLSPKAKAKQDFAMASKLPHVRVVMEANAALFVHRAARSLYDYSVPQSDEHVTGGNIVLCFRQLAAQKIAAPTAATGASARDSQLRSSQSHTQEGRGSGSQAAAKSSAPSRNVNSSQNVIYIDEDDGDGEENGNTPGRANVQRGGKGAVIDDLQDYVGRIFYSRHDLYRMGLHMTYSTSICGNMEKGADSILLSDSGAPPVNERLLYTCVTNSHENQIERAILQINVLNDVPVRLVRGWRADYESNKSGRSNEKADERMWYRYDGLYTVRHYVEDSASRDESGRRGDGSVFCEFLLTRLPLYSTPSAPPVTPNKRPEPPKPTLPSISSLTSLPLPSSSFRDARKIDLRQGDYMARDYAGGADDDGVEIIEVKHAQPHHLHHPTSSTTTATSSSTSSTSSSSPFSSSQQQPRLLPPTSSLLNPSVSSSPLRRLSNSEPPAHTTTSYSQLLPASSPHRQQQPQAQQAQQQMSNSSIPLPGILPYIKTGYGGPSPSPPSSSGSGGGLSSKLSAPPSVASLPLPPLPPTHAASLSASGKLPSPPSSNSNLNTAVLMYNLFGGNPMMQTPGLAPLHPALTLYGADPQQLHSDHLSRLAAASAPLAAYQAQQHHVLPAVVPPSAQPVTTLQPSLYEVPTAHLLYFMNLIPQKDREIALIMRQKELDKAKPKRKDDSHDNKRKRKSKEEAKKKNGGSGGSKSNGKHSRKSTSSSFDDEYIDLGLVDNEDDEIINNWSSRRRGATVQKKSDVEWEKVKELAAAERSVKRKKTSGGGGGGISSASSSRPSKTEPMDTEPSRAPKQISPGNKRSRIDRKGRAAEGDDEGSIFCICRSPEEYGFMIACDKCNEWFHGGCVGLTPEEGQDLKTYICPRCQPPNPRKKALPFGDALSFAAASPNGARTSRGSTTKKEAAVEEEEEEIVVDEEKVEWNQLGEVIYCGDGDMTDDYQSDDPSGFVFVAYLSFQDIAREREEARKTREDYIKKQKQQRYLKQRLQAMIKQDHAPPTNDDPTSSQDLGQEPALTRAC